VTAHASALCGKDAGLYCSRIVKRRDDVLQRGGLRARDDRSGSFAGQSVGGLVREGVCFSGNVTVSTDTVQLVPREASDAVKLPMSADEPSHENDVLVVDYYGHFENRPVLRWLAPQELQVTIPNISGIGLHKDSYRDVKISIRYEPDDPAARERWRKEHGLPN
jgi:hypothetical protein